MDRRALIIAGVLSLCAPLAVRADEKAAEAALKKLGAKSTRDEARPGKPIYDVDLTFSKVKDADLVHLKQFKHLELLAAGDSAITDAGLVHLKQLPKLRALGLVDLKGITDKGLVHVKGMKNLETLNLVGTKVTDKGVADLQKALPRLFIIR